MGYERFIMFENFLVMFCVFGIFEHCTKNRQQKSLTSLNSGGKLHLCSLVLDILTQRQIVAVKVAVGIPHASGYRVGMTVLSLLLQNQQHYWKDKPD
jgi:hypothetical protein